MDNLINALYIRSIIIELSDRTLQIIANGLRNTDTQAILARAILKERSENKTR